eukprot:TRINITY_DN56288_c0_g1_i1.p1 TRINITY_DN56288_c0_g1~~TRINITY_DN56288_c0_g1_i1.p1  ORF type:complete len:157 (+),score=50.44 TRINITY_DN56288_c0_g1_i1:73-543(+)
MSYHSHLQRLSTPPDQLMVAVPEAEDAEAPEGAEPRMVCRKDIFLAAIEGDIECIEKNLELGVDINSMGQPAKIWGTRFEKSTGFRAAPLHYAAAYGRELAVKLLLDRGARPSIKSHSGLKPQEYARLRQYGELADLIQAKEDEERGLLDQRHGAN